MPSVNLQPVMPTPIDWARLAAFIDGEGTIYINSQKMMGRMRSPRHFLSVVVTNTNPKLILWLKNVFGGSVYAIKKGKYGKPSHKQCYRWQLNELLGGEILRGCLPYFIIKREHAEIGLAFLELKAKQNGRQGKRLSEEVLSSRQFLADQIVELNGRSHTPLDLVQ